MSEFQTPSNQIKEFLEKDNFQDLEQYINQADLSLEPFLIDSLPEILYKLTNNKTSEEAKNRRTYYSKDESFFNETLHGSFI